MSNDAEQAAEEADADEDAAATDEGATVAARVREHDEDLGDEVADLESRVAELKADLADAEAEVADLTERLQTKQADFQNYKQRTKRRQDEIRERATEDLVERLLDVRDNLDRALDEESGDAQPDDEPGDDAGLREFKLLCHAASDAVLPDSCSGRSPASRNP